MLAGAEEDQQGQFGADEAFAWARRCGEDQVGHGVGGSVDPPHTGAAQALPTGDGLEPLQPSGSGRDILRRS